MRSLVVEFWDREKKVLSWVNIFSGDIHDLPEVKISY